MTSQAYIYPLLHNSSKTGLRIKAIHGENYDKSQLANFIQFICLEKDIPLNDTGFCLTCGEPVPDQRRWCDAECRDMRDL